MEVFIKDAKTFATKSHHTVLDYDITPSIYDTVSTITIPQTEEPAERDFVYLDGAKWLGIIGNVSTDDGRTTLECSQISTLFNRDLFYTAGTYTYLEDYLKTLIDDNYTNCVDTFYSLPFLDVEALTSTTGSLKPDLDDNIYNISSFMAKLRRIKGIYTNYTISRTKLYITIVTRANPVKNVDFSNPSFVITEQNFSAKTISKITTYCEENAQTRNWVLLDDGSIVNSTPTAGRVSGEWVALVVSNADDVAPKVQEEFARNFYSHNITFMCPLNYQFDLYDNLRIKIGNKIFTSYVAQKHLWANSKVQEIQCGELQMQYPYLTTI